MKETLLKEKFAEAYYEPDTKLVVIIWGKKCTSQEYRFAFRTLLDHYKKAEMHFYLSDIRNQPIVSPADRKWFETVAMPESIENGLLKAAVVFKGNPFKKYYINLILKATNKFNLPLKLFLNLDDAKQWLFGK